MALLGTDLVKTGRTYSYRSANRVQAGYKVQKAFSCHRRGKNTGPDTEQSETQVEGIVKRRRKVRAKSIKAGCHARMVCSLQTRQRPHGSPVDVYYITYILIHWSKVTATWAHSTCPQQLIRRLCCCCRKDIPYEKFCNECEQNLGSLFSMARQGFSETILSPTRTCIMFIIRW